MSAPVGHIRIVLIQESPIMRAGLRLLLEQQPDLAVVGEATTCTEAGPIVAQVQPDLLLFDLNPNTISSLDQLPAVLAAADRVRLLVLLSPSDLELQPRVVQLGAVGIVRKDEAPVSLFRAIRKVHAGEVWIDRLLMARVLTDVVQGLRRVDPPPDAARIALLTAREREVIALVGDGLRNKQIAERLSVSETTVRHHLTSIFSKLGVADRLDLVIYAYRHGLARPPG